VSGVACVRRRGRGRSRARSRPILRRGCCGSVVMLHLEQVVIVAMVVWWSCDAWSVGVADFAGRSIDGADGEIATVQRRWKCSSCWFAKRHRGVCLC